MASLQMGRWAVDLPTGESLWYGMGRQLVSWYAQAVFNPDVVRQAPLPAGPKLIVANHPTTTDPFVILTLLEEQVSILVSETLFKVPVFGRYLERAGHVRVVHANGRSALEAGRRLLDAGRSVVIFPEGAISPAEGGVHVPRTGAARLALLTGVPVVPVGMGLQRSLIKRIETRVDGQVEVGTWYVKGPYAMTVGAPLYFKGEVEDREQVREVSRQIMDRIVALAQLSDQRAARIFMAKGEKLPGSSSFNVTSGMAS